MRGPDSPASLTPWRSIADGIVTPVTEERGYAAARVSPCASCATAPCCTHLPLHTFPIRTIKDLDHAVYVLNFAHMELGLSATGEWSVYYRYPCRFLDRHSFGCTLHDAPEQPRICVNYNPYHCWYRRALTRARSEEFLRIDAQRMAYIVEHVRFDEDGALVQVPDWVALREALLALPPAPPEPDEEPALQPPYAQAWREDTLAPARAGEAPRRLLRYAETQDPCSGCAAPCCKTLLFPFQIPRSRPALDYLRFVLGFPGLSVGISEGAWSLVVHTRCRHLQPDNRCSLFGRPERPLLCRYYDASSCSYRLQFGPLRPEGFLLLQLDHFPQLADSFLFDESGIVARAPSVAALRQAIEDRWRAAGPEVNHGPPL